MRSGCDGVAGRCAPGAAGPPATAGRRPQDPRPSRDRTGLGPHCAGRAPALRVDRAVRTDLRDVQRASRADGSMSSAEMRRPMACSGRRPGRDIPSNARRHATAYDARSVNLWQRLSPGAADRGPGRPGECGVRRGPAGGSWCRRGGGYLTGLPARKGHTGQKGDMTRMAQLAAGHPAPGRGRAGRYGPRPAVARSRSAGAGRRSRAAPAGSRPSGTPARRPRRSSTPNGRSATA